MSGMVKQKSITVLCVGGNYSGCSNIKTEVVRNLVYIMGTYCCLKKGDQKDGKESEEEL